MSKIQFHHSQKVERVQKSNPKKTLLLYKEYYINLLYRKTLHESCPYNYKSCIFICGIWCGTQCPLWLFE